MGIKVLEGAKARKCFSHNSRLLGCKRGYNHGGLLSIALTVTLAGVNPATARLLNWLYRYLLEGKPHGFLKHLRAAALKIWLLS